ncbi:hypothetical protein [Desulfoluna spongiiphila]|uniref:Uncharacterized protein n=1 Tax=Desulfoluna spongiiphila TaxID=419481 RepID=A0A1G5DX79_9BACT|nr:hypothetical protein [Desulfoluna spongiiphila]SCY18798.1 hypothetical protein SAMN05216233_10523 [Desulfoluna spongiiphila]VVS91445.1 hypothetical protein DBB_10130 [Desulfoluna spongiiphila]
MKINFTKKEYRQLLDLVYIANWVMNARNIEKDTKTEKYDELVQKVYSFAGEFKFSDLIEFNKQLEGYYPTNKYEMDGDVHQFIDEYDDECFWESLYQELGKRDFIEEVGMAEAEKMEPIDRFTAINERADKYSREFEKNGIKNLKII